ncbi:hypothetical protein LQZ19_18385 [Treponema primitia]|uniref:hypothetical protein n=1 Tax=Treponema primitia TaxID=88058 RepID=UPI00397F0E32
MTRKEKQARLIAGYHKISPGGRGILDKTVRDLAELPSLPTKTVLLQNSTDEEEKSIKEC